MFRYFLKRIGYMLLAVLVISAITFSLLQLAPGNYLDTQRLLEKTMTDATVSAQMKEAWEKFYGLDQPPLQRYVNFLVNAVKGEFGPSYKYPTQNIEDIIARTLPISARLALMAIGVALLVGIPLGIIAAIYQNKILDRVVVFFSMLGSSIPAYVLAVLLSWWLGVSMHLLPVIGWGSPINYVLPIISLALGPIGTVTKYTRSTLVETFNQEYIKVARAKGGNFFQVTPHHSSRPHGGYAYGGHGVCGEYVRYPGFGPVLCKRGHQPRLSHGYGFHPCLCSACDGNEPAGGLYPCFP